jgi:copper chaperone NosL
MKNLPRLLMFVTIPLTASLFFFPLWQITLEAPQYPDGITMYIWINQITGDTEFTLQNINILNHYIGMKYIEPDSIPELTYFPYIISGLLVLELIAVVFQNKWLYLGLGALVFLLAALGIYDFYTWLYDYGHNLDPNAPIKVPGMVYQPPLIGSKMLLNFNAISWPATGGILFLIGNLFGFLAWAVFPKVKH